jgi:hypothetical protein
MNCAVFSMASSGGRAFGLTCDLAGAGQPVQAPGQHADGLNLAYGSHTLGGLGVWLLCPLPFALCRVLRFLLPAARIGSGAA